MNNYLLTVSDFHCENDEAKDRGWKEETTGFVSSGDKLLLTDNNVAIGIQGRSMIKGYRTEEYLAEHF